MENLFMEKFINVNIILVKGNLLYFFVLNVIFYLIIN